jgi:cell division septation protein DedD
MERISEALAKARQQREQLLERGLLDDIEGRADAELGLAAAGRTAASPLLDARMWVAVVAAASVIVLVLMLGSRQQKQEIGLNALEVEPATRSGPVAQPNDTISTTGELQHELTMLEARMDSLGESVTRLDRKLTEVYARIDAIDAADSAVSQAAPEKDAATPEPVSAQQAPMTAADQEPLATEAHKGSATAATELMSAEQAPASPKREAKPPPATHKVSAVAAAELVAAEQATGAAGDDGGWVINVASFPDRPTAERFAARAQSKKVRVVTRQATVKGKPYWRVQVPGFVSAGEARAEAASVEAKLGLKDTWVSRR